MPLPPHGGGGGGGVGGSSGNNTKSSGSGGTSHIIYNQPGFDKRITSLADPMSSGQSTKLARGFMIWDTSVSSVWGRGMVNFLYNPSVVTASYDLGLSQDVSSLMMFHDPADTEFYHTPLSQSVSWSLFFDRTYELWGGYNQQGQPRFSNQQNNPSTSGVMVDIKAMKNITGQFIPDSNSSANFGGLKGKHVSPQLQQFQGPMLLVPTWVYFGNPLGMVYYGYVTDFTVTVSHWTQFMVPMRCEIDVDFALLIPTGNYKNGAIPGEQQAWAELGVNTHINRGTKGGSGGKKGGGGTGPPPIGAGGR